MQTAARIVIQKNAAMLARGKYQILDAVVIDNRFLLAPRQRDGSFFPDELRLAFGQRTKQVNRGATGAIAMTLITRVGSNQ